MAQARARLIRLRPAFGLGASMMTVWGLVYAYPLFVAHLSSELHVDRAALAGVVVALLFWGAVVGPPIGALVDRIGPRPAIIAGLLVAIAGMAAFSQARELWQVYLTFAGVLATGQTLIYLGSNVLIGRAFAGERATAFGIAYAGLGLGTGLYAIGGQLLIDALSWRTAALVLAGTPLLVVPFALRLGRGAPARPQVVGRPVTGSGTDRAESPAGAASPVVAPGTVSASREERHPGATVGAFALILLVSASLGLMDEGVYQNLLPHAVTVGYSPTLAALALSFASWAYVVGQLVGGPAADRWGARPVALVAFAVAAVGTAGIVTAGVAAPMAELRLLGAAMLYGGGLAVLLLVRLATFADRFAGPRFGFLSGIFALAYPVGGSFVAWFGGFSYDAWGSYLPAFAVSAAGLAAATGLLIVVIAPVVARRPEPSAARDTAGPWGAGDTGDGATGDGATAGGATGDGATAGGATGDGATAGGAPPPTE
jgi:MFS family permease